MIKHTTFESKIFKATIDEPSYKEILKQLNTVLNQQYTFNGLVSSTEAAIVSYFDSSPVSAPHAFKEFLIGIKELLQEKDRDSAEEIYEKLINFADEYTITYDYPEHHQLLGEIQSDSSSES